MTADNAKGSRREPRVSDASSPAQTQAESARAFREAIAPERRHLFDAAVTGAAQVLADVRTELARAYDRGGPMEVARAAYVPGGPPLEEIARRYEARLAGEDS